MAEAVMRAKVAARGLQDRIEVNSCGLGDWHLGHPPHPGTRKVLDEAGISYESQRAKKLSADEILAYDYIIAMDHANVAGLEAIGVPRHRVRLLTDFSPKHQGIEVPDPYYHGNFDYVFELVQASVDGLLKEMQGE